MAWYRKSSWRTFTYIIKTKEQMVKDEETPDIKQTIVAYSQAVRKHYPEINNQLPLNW